MPRASGVDPGPTLAVAPLRADPHPGALRAILHLGYDLVWLLATLVCSPVLLWKAWRQPGFAHMVRERLMLTGPLPPREPGRRRVLVHGVSVGEIKTAAPIVERIERDWPELEVVISATTDTGLEIARDLFAGRPVVRFPLDLSWVVRRFLRALEVDSVILVELEIWPNFMRVCNQMGLPVVVVNGRITPVSYGQYVLFRSLLPQFDRISLYCAQDEDYASRFRELCANPERVLVTGNVKADGLRTGPVDPGEERRRLLGGAPGQQVIVAGSTHEPEERLLIEAWRASAPDARLILVPRHPVRAPQIERDLAQLGARPQRLSRLRAGDEAPDPARPALVDTIGELERVYALADLVFVGGSLVPHGGQNMLEPAAQGRPVLFGPHVANFTQEARLLLAAGAARQVAGAGELTAALRELAADRAAREAMGAAGLEAVEAQKGATELTIRALAAHGLGPSRPAEETAAPRVDPDRPGAPDRPAQPDTVRKGPGGGARHP